jgi:hypothetical protein
VLTLADRLLLLAFELRLSGWPATDVTVLYVSAQCLRWSPGRMPETIP